MNRAKEVCVCLRLDDYTSETPIGVVRELATILERHKAICLFGVIPFSEKLSETGERLLDPLSGPMADLLRELVERELVVPAVHGFVHQRSADGLEEFASGSVTTQRAKIAQGKSLLEQVLGRPVRAFVPPWNVVSEATETALQELGFSYLSTALAVDCTSHWDLIDVPGTCFWTSREGVLNALDHLDSSPIVVFTGHFFDFHEPSGALKHDTLDRFDRVLTWLGSLNNVRVVSMDEASTICARERVARKSIARSRGAFGLPYRVRRAIEWPHWFPTTGVSASLRRIQAIGLAVWAGLVSFSFLVGYGAGSIQPWHLAGWLALALLVPAGIMAVLAVTRNFARQTTRAALLATVGGILGIACAGFLRP